MPAAKAPKPPGVARLFKQALADYRRWFRILASVALFPALIFALLSPLEATPEGLLLRAYSSILGLVMNLALIWTIITLHAGATVKVKQAYYEGTASLVRFTLVSVVLGLQLLPLVLGGVLFGAATTNVSTAVTLPEQLLILLLWLILALPSAYWLTRNAFGPLIVASSKLSPLAALSRSRKLVKTRFWSVSGRLFGLLIALSVFSVVPMVAVLLVLPPGWGQFGLIAWQLLVTVTLLPISYLYLFRLFLALQDHSTSNA
jgi:hypothetical protein